eukprot:11719846-Heterocapsa_arctica.AAC.1
MKGIMTKCILALGYIYQTNICDELKGIMELVVWLEKNIKAPENIGDRKQEEEKSVGIKDFNEAINMLKDMNEDLVKANLEEARRTRDI